MRTIIKENDWFKPAIMEVGWGNGYVVLPIGHKYHGVPYMDIPVDVHYGLTFGREADDKLIAHWPELTEADKGCWIIGFDTCHHNDDEYRWPKEAVQAEADRLMAQLV